MENQPLGLPQSSTLPPGVTQQQAQQQTGMPGATQQQQQPAQPQPMQPAMPMEAAAPKEKWNWLVIGGGILLATTLYFVNDYYRTQKKTVNPALESLGSRISSLETIVDKLTTPAAA